MYYIGIDVHRNWSTFAALNPQTGEMLHFDKVANTRDAFAEILSSLEGPLHAVCESGTNAWCMYRILLTLVDDVSVANPSSLWNRRTDRQSKTDKKDASRMALMLSRGEIEALYVPDERTQEMRTLTRSRSEATTRVTRIVNHLSSMLRSHGIRMDKSLLSKKAEQTLRDILESDQLSVTVKGIVEREFQSLLKALDDEAWYEQCIKATVAADETCQLLLTIPGVGPYTALCLRAEIGDIRRFKSAKSLCSYMGLTPRVFQSGESCYYGRLGKWGNRWLKCIVGLFSQRVHMSREDTSFKRTYYRMLKRSKHPNVAKVVVCRKFVRVIYRMLTSGVGWCNPLPGPT